MSAMKTYHEQKQALGSTVFLTIVSEAGDEPVNDLMRRLWLEVFLFEKRCSRFLPNSELSQLNRGSGLKQHVSPEFREVLLAAQRMSQLTDGLYNPFVLPALQRAGYKQSLVKEYSHDPVDDHSAKQIVPASSLEINDNWVTIPYGTALDLGGCGKGYIGDVLADIAEQEQGMRGFWFSIGGDIVTSGLNEQGQPWVVQVAPSVKDMTQTVACITMPDSGRYAVATSTTALRKGVQQGKSWHHIIDPRTGQPAASNVTMASVCSQTLLEADVLASCAIIVGEVEAEGFLQQHDVGSALIAIRDGYVSAKTAHPDVDVDEWLFRSYGAHVRLASSVRQAPIEERIGDANHA